MKRAALEYLLEWKKRERRKPLVVRGARQVGKSYLVADFAEREFATQLTINADRDRTFLKRIVDEPPARMLQAVCARRRRHHARRDPDSIPPALAASLSH
jgi:hypothetical protein